MERKTIILIVDDSESVCSAITFLLGLEGYETITAPDGEEGVRMAQQYQPDVILLDIMMPVLDGWGAVKQLKSNPQTAGIPVLALTALRLSQTQIDAAGFEGYLSKPVPAHRLKEEIRRVCSHAR